jgi:aspartate-semialdehyde dehydrogenase
VKQKTVLKERNNQMVKKKKVAVVGVGAVGVEMVRLLEKREFPLRSLTIFARSERKVEIDGFTFLVKVATPESFKGMDFVFFAGTEGAKGASQTFGQAAINSGCIVIDNGDDFRMDPRVPLVIPEINPEALAGHHGLIANPNCSTIIALMALAPLHKVAKIRRVVMSTYQAVSGTGAPAIGELEKQVGAWARKRRLCNSVYPHQIAFNVLPSIGSFKGNSGESTEEVKMRVETHKILDDTSIRINSTCVRVPVFNGHSISMNVEFVKRITPEQARDILSKTNGVKVIDDPANNIYPMPISASGKCDVEVGRIRADQTVRSGLSLWCSGDNIWKGAAQNAIQIAECLLSKSK